MEMKRANSLEEKMRFYQEMLIQMVNRVEEAILQAQHAFRNHDTELARKVIANDWFIDQLQDMVENDGVRLLISETPYGHYMRHIIAGMKIVSSLERMGDHAAHLAKMSTAKEYDLCVPFVERIGEMALLGATMTRMAVEAFMDVKSEKAIEVALMDDRMDAMRNDINRDLFATQPTGPGEMERLLNLFYLTKEMERFGDHVTTICRWIVYMEKGERPRLNGPRDGSPVMA
ncbi:MAG: phosphate signaling complex protein PhoU [Sphaerochaetaceae bacterium]|jgi:phosphate transport system protein|nr:phosphate signaling complex protein PhoU [Sphaerochaetaceae bacterium]MDD3942594.1 phosphate signaling complex protein PhoU [Sphaerochaetaceae bacterium]MDX9939813.1 phosphate signaling complex protein PhoU [Sphaerochaetaceae bacterium]